LGAGAAGIGAGRRLAKSGASHLLLEARDRLGGRALTIERDGLALDLGCGWMHSADKNVLAALAAAMPAFELDMTPAPWQRQSGDQELSGAEQRVFREAFARFDARIEGEAEAGPPVAASAYLEAGGRWNAMINAVFSYISGAAL